MEAKNSNRISKEIENLLNKYFGQNEAIKFCKRLKSSVLNDIKDDSTSSQADKAQLDSIIPTGIKERDLITSIVTYADKKFKKEKLLELLLDLAQLMTFRGEITIATELSEDVISKSEGDDNLLKYKADAYLSLARIEWSQAYWDQSFKQVQKSYEIFIKMENRDGCARCENMLATIYGEQGEISKSLDHLEKGLVFLAESENIELRAMFEVNLGILYNIMNDTGKALWNLKNALEKYEKLKDTRRAARVRHNLGILYTKKGDYQAALEEFNKSITISLENGYLSNCAIGYIGKAYIYTKLKNSALADVFTDKAMEISYKINDVLSIADVYKIKGMIQNDLENFELSEELFENSVRLNDDLGSNLNKAESIAELSDLYKKADQHDKSDDLKKEANQFFEKISSPDKN